MGISRITPAPRSNTIAHLKSDYIHEDLDLDVFEHAIALALRGAGYQESLTKAKVLCDPSPTIYELTTRGFYQHYAAIQ